MPSAAPPESQWLAREPAVPYRDGVTVFRRIFDQKVPCSIFNLMAGINAQATKLNAYRFSALQDQ